MNVARPAGTPGARSSGYQGLRACSLSRDGFPNRGDSWEKVPTEPLHTLERAAISQEERDDDSRLSSSGALSAIGKWLPCPLPFQKSLEVSSQPAAGPSWFPGPHPERSWAGWIAGLLGKRSLGSTPPEPHLQVTAGWHFPAQLCRFGVMLRRGPRALEMAATPGSPLGEAVANCGREFS